MYKLCLTFQVISMVGHFRIILPLPEASFKTFETGILNWTQKVVLIAVRNKTVFNFRKCCGKLKLRFPGSVLIRWDKTPPGKPNFTLPRHLRFLNYTVIYRSELTFWLASPGSYCAQRFFVSSFLSIYILYYCVTFLSHSQEVYWPTEFVSDNCVRGV
jgi:hypothetical protein